MRILAIISLLLFIELNLLAECIGYPCDTVWYNGDGRLNDLFVVKDFYFELGKTKLISRNGNTYTDSITAAKMYLMLDSLVDALKNDGGIFEIQMHSDCRGSSYSSSSPTQYRAKSICNYLIEKGISEERLIPKGYGQNSPRTIYKDGEEIVLTCSYINAFKSKDLERFELYHQYNRRVAIKRIA